MMSPALRAALDAQQLNADYFMYRLQEVIGFEHKACGLIEQLRGLCKHFASLPLDLHQIKDLDRDRKNIGNAIRQIKRAVGDAWDRGELTEEQRNAAKDLHKVAATVLKLLGIDARPPAMRGGELLQPFDWCTYLGYRTQNREVLDRVIADLGLLADASIKMSDQPHPDPDSIRHCLARWMREASNAFGGNHDFVIRRFHHDAKALMAALEVEGIIAARRP